MKRNCECREKKQLRKKCCCPCPPCQTSEKPSVDNPDNPVDPFSLDEVSGIMMPYTPSTVHPKETYAGNINPFSDDEISTMMLPPETKNVNNKYEEDSEIWFSKKPQPLSYTPPTTVMRQFTPDYTLDNINPQTIADKMVSDCALNLMGVTIFPDRTAPQPGNLGHDPRGIRLGFTNATVPTEADWLAAKWDGIPFNYAGKDKAVIWKWLVPVGNNLSGILRGIEDLYYDDPPFADKFNPKVIEIDNWNIKVINHIRSLLGIPGKVKPDPRLYLEVAWADERKYSTIWEPKYPGVMNSAYGPCQPQTNPQGHCGESFFPDRGDREKYYQNAPYNNDVSKYPELADHNKRISQASGTGGVGARLPWSMRLAQILTNYILTEGTSGHAGPALYRGNVGMSWRCVPGGQSVGGGMGFRAKWF